MRTTPRLAPTLFLGLLLAACGGDSGPPPGPGGPGGPGPGEGPAPVALGHQMPEYTPSGIKDDFREWMDAKRAWSGARLEDQKTKAEQALTQLTSDLIAKWGSREVPAPEALYYATILKHGEQYVEAIVQYRRYLDVGDPTSNNFLNCTTALIGCLSQTGDFDGAQAELQKAVDTVYKDKDMDRMTAETAIAMNMMLKDELARAAEHFETLATLGMGDPESALYAVDCYQRIGKPDEALRVAQKAADFYQDGRNGDRMKILLGSVNLLGRPAPDFSAARNWRGEGGPVTREMMQGHVTVVFSWNMQAQWVKWFFERINKLAEEFQPQGVIFVGISRLAKFDANKMITVADMTEEAELLFYDAWVREYKVTYPLAIGGFEEDALIDAWASQVIPAVTVVGKDGKVFYVRTGKNPEHMDALRDMILKALAK